MDRGTRGQISASKILRNGRNMSQPQVKSLYQECSRFLLTIYHKLNGLKHCICYLRMPMGQEPLYSLAGSFCFSRGKTQILKGITALCHLVPTEGSNMAVYVFKTDYRCSLLKCTISTGVTTRTPSILFDRLEVSPRFHLHSKERNNMRDVTQRSPQSVSAVHCC